VTATCHGFLPKTIFRLLLRGFSDTQFTVFSNTYFYAIQVVLDGQVIHIF